jgi:cytidine deaminase
MQPEELVQIARSSAKNARAPYSHFPVGAAVEADDGQIYRGCNVESASYSLTMCAERVAIFTAIAAGASPRRLAVSCLQGDPADPGSLMPCGACRQVMRDQMPPDATVIVDGVGEFSVAELLPVGFRIP